MLFTELCAHRKGREASGEPVALAGRSRRLRLHRQVVCGRARRAGRSAEADAYFATRPHGSKLGALRKPAGGGDRGSVGARRHLVRCSTSATHPVATCRGRTIGAACAWCRRAWSSGRAAATACTTGSSTGAATTARGSWSGSRPRGWALSRGWWASCWSASWWSASPCCSSAERGRGPRARVGGDRCGRPGRRACASCGASWARAAGVAAGVVVTAFGGAIVLCAVDGVAVLADRREQHARGDAHDGEHGGGRRSDRRRSTSGARAEPVAITLSATNGRPKRQPAIEVTITGIATAGRSARRHRRPRAGWSGSRCRLAGSGSGSSVP